MSIRPVADETSVPILEVELEEVAEPASLPEDELGALTGVSDDDLREFEATFNRIKQKRLGVNVVVLKGMQRTKQYIVARELRHLPDAANLDELKDALLDAWAALLKLDIFDAVDVVIDEGSQLPVSQRLCFMVAQAI